MEGKSKEYDSYTLKGKLLSVNNDYFCVIVSLYILYFATNKTNLLSVASERPTVTEGTTTQKREYGAPTTNSLRDESHLVSSGIHNLVKL